MEITEQTFIATVTKLHSIQLKKTEGYTQDATSCFIKKHRIPGRTLELFLDYDESSTLQARVQQARERAEKLRCEAADVDTVMPMLLKDKQQSFAVMMVLQHRFVNHRWYEHMDIYYPDERVKGLLFDPLQAWFPNTRYINTATIVFHDPSPLAALLALVCAFSLHHQVKLAVNYYSPAYARQMKQLVHQLYAEDVTLQLQSLAYHMIPHVGRHYDAALTRLMEQCLLMPQHQRLLAYLDTLVTQTLNLCADPNAASGLMDQAERLDPHQRKRICMTVLVVAVTIALLLMTTLGVMGNTLVLTTGVSTAAVAAGALAMTYLWKRSEYRQPSLSLALKNLSIAVAPPRAPIALSM